MKFTRQKSIKVYKKKEILFYKRKIRMKEKINSSFMLGFIKTKVLRKIIEDNQESIIFPISSFKFESIEGDGN